MRRDVVDEVRHPYAPILSAAFLSSLPRQWRGEVRRGPAEGVGRFGEVKYGDRCDVCPGERLGIRTGISVGVGVSVSVSVSVSLSMSMSMSILTLDL